MKIILLERVNRLGGIGDQVNVKDGYARNFLIPQGKALRANKDNIAYYESKKSQIEKENAKRRADAEKHSQNFDGKSVILVRQASDDGHLYGSVGSRDIATAIAELESTVTHKHISLNDSIKAIGLYNVKVNLHPEVTSTVKVVVARSESEAEEILDPSKKKTGKKEEASAEAEAPAPESLLENPPAAEDENAA